MIRKETLETLEFGKVLERVSAFSHSEASRHAVLSLAPLSSREEITHRFRLVGELRRLRAMGAHLGFSSFEDITGPLHRVRPEGAMLEAGELLSIAAVLAIVSSIAGAVRERRDEAPSLAEAASDLTGSPDVLRSVARSIDSEGKVMDTASHELMEVRKNIRALERKINHRLEEITRDAALAPFLQDDFITKRSGRWVIPVRMDSKGMVKGVVHDVSRSGETAFMEPLETIGMSNELENLMAEEKAEEIRILKALSGLVRAEAESIAAQFETLVELDALQSIAEFSDLLGMEEPEINESRGLTLRGARHPLLMLRAPAGGPGKPAGRGGVVPLNLALGDGRRVMVITGPNAGGKTIAVKTAGLLLLMALSGMPVPADSSSSVPLVKGVLVDIGDEQSIEADLSTFSAHVSNISRILREAETGTLVILDELGTGTDPQQGAALGSAIIKDLRDKGALVLATTHLIDIVGYVHRSHDMVNASMDFDQKTLTPLYRLTEGEPGQSHALEIAEKFGLPKHVVREASAMMGTAQAEFTALVRDLQKKRSDYETTLAALGRREEELRAGERALKARIEQAERERKDTLEKALEEARALVVEYRRKAHDALEEARREKSRASLKELDRARRQIEHELRKSRKEAPLPLEEIREGETVFVRGIGYDATVKKVLKGRVRVAAGDKELEVPVEEIFLKQGIEPERKVTYDVSEETAPGLELNLVGLRVDPGLATCASSTESAPERSGGPSGSTSGAIPLCGASEAESSTKAVGAPPS